ncbi:MAG: SpoIIE family protein phosphatase [Oscillospiraceae bacterium]|nr:SpoIIE family protein phosphatase [Oscillospiraceae bacterium]
MAQVREHLNSFLYTMLLIALGIVLIAILSYMVFVRRVVIKPIGKLAAFTKEITDSGKFEDQHIDIHTSDEIEELSSSFNFMLKELENYISNLSKVTAEKERIGAELDIAAHIQASMLPCIFPAFPERREFEIFASMTPAKEVGGDFYDFFMVDETHLAIVMADVSGKGVPAALFMVIGKTLIKDHTLPGRDLGQVTFVNAGHEPPCICRKRERYAPYKIRPGFILAGMEGMRYTAGSITLSQGDKIFQYTDGVTEATSAEEKLYGMERLEAVLNRCVELSPTQLLPEVKMDIDRFVGDAPQFDDITMLCLEFKEKYVEEGGQQ